MKEYKEPVTREDILALLTVQMRVYDVLMVILAGTAPEKAKELWELHNKGELQNPALFLPVFDED